DFDETLPGPWEWDVKRLTTSFVVAGQHNGFRPKDARAAGLACARSYREQIARLARMRALDVWYERVDVDELLARTPQSVFRKQGRAAIAATSGGSEHVDAKLIDAENDGFQFRD